MLLRPLPRVISPLFQTAPDSKEEKTGKNCHTVIDHTLQLIVSSKMIKLTKQIDLEGYTLILPAIAVGNVAQLAVDLLIHNTNMRRIGQAINPGFIPIIGADPYEICSPNTCTTSDLYVEETSRVIVLQIRSPGLNKLNDFFEKLREFLTKEKIAKVIILTSEWQFVRVDSQLRSAALRYISSENIDEQYGKLFESLKWRKLENSVDPFNNESSLRISGGGFALNLYDFLNQRKVPCAILLKFCSEGNNSPDAKELANFLNDWISLVPKNDKGSIDWKEPPSWLHIFGHEAPSELY